MMPQAELPAERLTAKFSGDSTMTLTTADLPTKVECDPIVGERAIRTLNRKFLKKDRPTDVLSFPLGEKGPDGKFYLGDIVIAVPVAFRQSRAKGHGLDRELRLLAIHGFLHLLGYDHSAGIEDEERKAHRLYLT